MTAAAASAPIVISCPDYVESGDTLTADRRRALFGVMGGGSSTKPEDFQRKAIAEGTGIPCPKRPGMRINLDTSKLVQEARPNVSDNGFELTEDFDGIQEYGGKQILYNFKWISGSGGAQTRSLREVYHHVKGQLEVLLTDGGGGDLLFVNVLDGDECSKVMPKFRYLLGKERYAAIQNKVYVGDLKGVFAWLTVSLT